MSAARHAIFPGEHYMQAANLNPITTLANRFFVFLICVSMTSMVILVFSNAILRYGFHSSIPESEELARYFFIWTCFLGIVAAYARNRHVGVTFLSEHLKGCSSKILSIIAFLLQAAAFIVMFLGGWEYLDIIGDSKGQATGIPEAYIVSSILFASSSMMAILVYRLFALYSGRNKDEEIS